MADLKDILKKPINYVKGVGDSRARLFNRLNIFNVEDVITYFPREYEDRSQLKKIIDLRDGEACTFEGVIATEVTETIPRHGLSICKLLIKDETGAIIATWFNQPYIKKAFVVGDTYFFFGKVSRKFRAIEVLNPVYEKLEDKGRKNTCRIVPIYPATSNLTQNVIRSVISNSLQLLDGGLEEIIPKDVRNKYHLSEINYSIENIHFPKSDEDFVNARYRLVFEELLLLQLGLLNIKNTYKMEVKGIQFKKTEKLGYFIESLPFKLTNAQKKVFKEIEEDMESDKVMNILVQGDVASGKTIIAVMALFKAFMSGYQGALMVPTEILAEQHFRSITGLLEKYDVKIELLTGSQTKKQKTDLLERISKGEIDIVIGTHALIEENVIFKKLGLVITDEQHRFGVRQRSKLSKKGANPDVLVMSATPIPRTLALILYGDLDISVIDELPSGRKPIETYVVDSSMRDRINNFIRKKVKEGRQVFIVCPLVEESEVLEAASAQELADRIAKHDFADLRVGLVHGKMKSKDKEIIMLEFLNGNVDILVSTTVIEVGVNIPNATVMVIENAERFGLAQLHQLRGRVGRAGEQSFCILYNDTKTQISIDRMNVIRSSNDGFVISEKDLQLRGPGEFFGTMQHGIPDLKIANLYRDIEILKAAQVAAIEILDQDKDLANEENKRLREKLIERFQSKMNELSLN